MAGSEVIGSVLAEFRLGLARVRSDITRARSLISGLQGSIRPIDVRVNANIDQVRRDLESLRRLIRDQQARIEITSNSTEIEGDLQRLGTVADDQQVVINVRATDVADVRRRLDELRAAGQSVPSNIVIRVNSDVDDASGDVDDLTESIDEATDSADLLKAALAGALAVLSGGLIFKGFTGIDEANAEIKLLRERLITLSNSEISAPDLDKITQAVRDVRIRTGIEYEKLTIAAQNAYAKLGDAEQIETALQLVPTVALNKGLDPDETLEAYIEFARNFKNENPGEVLRNFLAALELSPNVEDSLDTIREYSVQLKGIGQSSANSAAALVEFSKTQFNTDKPFDALKELALVMQDDKLDLLEIVSGANQTPQDRQLIAKIRNGYNSFADLSNVERGALSRFARTQAMSTKQLFETIQGSNAQVISDFLGRDNDIYQGLLNKTVNTEDLAKELGKIYKQLDNQEKQNFVVRVNSQFEDIGLEGVGTFLEFYSNLNEKTAEFKENSEGIGERIGLEFNESLTAVDRLQIAFRNLTEGEGLQTLSERIRPFTDAIILQIAQIIESINSFLISNQDFIVQVVANIAAVITKVGNFVREHQVLIGRIAAGLAIIAALAVSFAVAGAALKILGLLFGLAGTGLKGLGAVIKVAGNLFGILVLIVIKLITGIRKLGTLLLYLGRFVIKSVILPALTALATALGIPVGVVAAVIAAIGLLISFAVLFKDQIFNIMEKMQSELDKFAPRLKNVGINLGISLLQGLLDPIVKSAGFADSVLSFLGFDNSFFKDVADFNNYLEGLKRPEDLGKLFEDGTESVKNVFSYAGQQYGDRFKELGNDIKSVISDIPIVGDLINGKNIFPDLNFGADPGEGGVDEKTGVVVDPALQKSLDELNKTNFDAVNSYENAINTLSKTAPPTAETTAAAGLRTNTFLPQPVQQTNNIYNPYDEKKVNNTLKAQKNTKTASIGRRATPACGA